MPMILLQNTHERSKKGHSLLLRSSDQLTDYCKISLKFFSLFTEVYVHYCLLSTFENVNMIFFF